MDEKNTEITVNCNQYNYTHVPFVAFCTDRKSVFVFFSEYFMHEKAWHQKLIDRYTFINLNSET